MVVDSVAKATGKAPAREEFEGLTWSLYQFGKTATAAQYQGCSVFVDPDFVSIGPTLFSDSDLEEYITLRIWRMMLSFADRCAVEGVTEVEIGDEDGFVERVDYMILERIPVRPKQISSFLTLLYEEYRSFVSSGLDLPERGFLRATGHRLVMQLHSSESEGSEQLFGSGAEVTFG
jgi:hypothetical protein